MPIIFVLLSLGWRDSAWLWLVVPASAATAATLSWVLVERPALALKSRWRVRAVRPGAWRRAHSRHSDGRLTGGWRADAAHIAFPRSGSVALRRTTRARANRWPAEAAKS